MILLLLLLFVNFSTLNNTTAPIADKISVAGLKELNKIIKQRSGKILLLNVWATWCIPCKEEFPDLNLLALKRKDIEIIGLSIDYPDEIESKIKPFLKKQPVKFRIYVNGEKSDEKLINFLSPSWGGAIPATFIYNTKGELKAVLEGKKTLQEFEEAVKQVKNTK